MLHSAHGVPIPGSDQRGALPPAPRLEAVALHLADAGNHRALVTLVETWAEQGTPTVPARIAEARALLALRMLDRAWVRLKDLVECAEPNPDALALAAEMFLLRGWPNQAKRVVQRGLDRSPQNAVLLALRERAQEPATTVDETAGEGELAPTAELVRVAEHHLARGAFVRARTLLERVRRRSPEHVRSADLLWGIAGELSTPEPLATFCARQVPDGPVELSDEPEHTESACLGDLRPLEQEAPFPRLFRNLRSPDDPSDEGELPLAVGPEITDVSSMAEGAELEGAFADKTDHGDDTQIARVMHKGSAGAPHNGSAGLMAEQVVHSGTTNVDSGFNLAEFRREMGMTSPELDSDYHVGPEDEDDSVIIHTGRGDGDAPADISDAKGRLARDAAHEKLAASKTRKGLTEDAWVATPWGAAPEPTLTDPGVASSRARTAPPAAEREILPEDAPTEIAEKPDLDEPTPPVRAARAAGGVPLRPAVAWPPPANTGGVAWPYWVAAMSAMLAIFVLLFAVISVVFAIT